MFANRVSNQLGQEAPFSRRTCLSARPCPRRYMTTKNLKLALLFSIVVSGVVKADEPIVFMGSPISVIKTDRDYADEFCDGGEECLTFGYNILSIKYSVELVFSGKISGNTVDFVELNHYDNLPGKRSSSIIVLKRNQNNLVHVKTFIPEEKRREWYICREWPENEYEDCLRWQKVDDYVQELQMSYNQSNKAQPAAAGTH